MLHFIVAPYHLGERAAGVGSGPLHILESRVAEHLDASVFEIASGDSCDWRQVNEHIREQVQRTLKDQAFPLVLAGNCYSCLGTLAGMNPEGLGIVWFDAHGDFHTHETSFSGNLEGMSLALATRELVSEGRVVLAGARDLDPGEDERVRQRLCFVPDANLGTRHLPDADRAYVHIDMDVLDPSISPGVNCETPGGLTVETLKKALASTFTRYKVEALAIANYNPSRDVEHRTRNIAVDLIEHIARLRQAAASR